MVLQDRPPRRAAPAVVARLLRGRALEDECARAARAGATFALARLRLAGRRALDAVVPMLGARPVPPTCSPIYGPQDYEILLARRRRRARPRRLVRRRCSRSCRPRASSAQCGVAWYPRDGRTADALLARRERAAQPAAGTPRTPARRSPELARACSACAAWRPGPRPRRTSTSSSWARPASARTSSRA